MGRIKSGLGSRWLIAAPALLVSLFSFVPTAEAFQVGLNAVGYTVTEIPPIKSDTAYVDGLYIDGRFTLPKPFASWSLDANYDWQAPVELPADGKIYSWDESNQVWVLVG